MASRLQSALPSHMKSDVRSNGEDGIFKPKHHGKSQSHVVSWTDHFLASSKLDAVYVAIATIGDWCCIRGSLRCVEETLAYQT